MALFENQSSHRCQWSIWPPRVQYKPTDALPVNFFWKKNGGNLKLQLPFCETSNFKKKLISQWFHFAVSRLFINLGFEDYYSIQKNETMGLLSLLSLCFCSINSNLLSIYKRKASGKLINRGWDPKNYKKTSSKSWLDALSGGLTSASSNLNLKFNALPR